MSSEEHDVEVDGRDAQPEPQAPVEQAGAVDLTKEPVEPAADDEALVAAPAVDEPAAPGEPEPPAPAVPQGGRRRKKRKQRSFFAELPFLVVLAIGLAFLIKTFLVQAFYIPSGSMEQTLMVNDRVLVNKLVYDTRDPKRGEIVVFDGAKTGTADDPHSGFKGLEENKVSPASNFLQAGLRKFQCFVGVGCTTDQDFIKRVIAVGGDTVQCCDDKGRVMVNGVPLDEPYVYEDNHMTIPLTTIPDGMLWVMGDHRGDSLDSRFRGAIPVDAVVGRAFVTVYPFSRFGGHGIPSTFDNRGSAAASLPLQATPGMAGLALALPVTGVRRRRKRRPDGSSGLFTRRAAGLRRRT